MHSGGLLARQLVTCSHMLSGNMVLVTGVTNGNKAAAT
jgi:hypothetical protein